MGNGLSHTVCSDTCANEIHVSCDTCRTETTKDAGLRPNAFPVLIYAGLSANMPLGITTRPDPEDPRCLTIKHIQDPSLVSTWNKVNHVGVKVVVGDFISSVNGVQGNTSAMTDQIITCGLSPEFAELHLEIWPRDVRRLHNEVHNFTAVLEQESTFKKEGTFNKEHSWTTQLDAGPDQSHTADDAEHHRANFKPGKIGVGLGQHGRVTSVEPDGQGEYAGITIGSYLVSIDGAPYTEDLLRSKAAGKEKYVVQFSNIVQISREPIFRTKIPKKAFQDL